MRRPEFITFTGADDRTDVAGMVALSSEFPVEWGILMSLSRWGVPRYPRHLERFMVGPLLRLSAHLCGGFGRDIMDGDFVELLPANVLAGFHRAQVNHAEPVAERIAAFQRHLHLPCIAQARGDVFPADASIAWLFDRSGGTGSAPERWPLHPGGERLVGYAGGIGPGNVREVLKAIDSSGRYWIDMESGVRTADDRLDLAACRRVCEAVYGEARDA